MNAPTPPPKAPPAAAPKPAPSGVPLWHLLPLRLYLGYAFVKFGLTLQGAFIEQNQLKALFVEWAPMNPYPAARAFLEGRGQLWSELLAYAVCYGAIAIGAALTAGLFTRGTAIAGAALTAATLVLGGHASPTLMAEGQLLIVALCTIALSGAGRFVGCDLWLHRRASVLPFTLLY